MTPNKNMTYTPTNYDHLLGTPGFSDTLLKNHFTLYQGYVNNTNKALDMLAKMDPTSYEFAEVKRRLGWEFNGMRLHEYYFGNMRNGGSTLNEESTFAQKINEQFGSFDAWMKDFRATGAMRGIGWVVLYYDTQAKRLINTWINEHDLGHFSGCTPLLVMDIFEHAFMIDYGLKRADYIEAFFKAIDWNAVEKRMN